MVVGAPQSGKSTLLRTVICALALTHTPSEVQFYCLDFNAGALRQLKDLPHVGGVTTRLDPERVQRTVAEVVAALFARQQFFRSQGITSMSSYRKDRAAGKWPDQQWGDVFLVIDDWSAFKQEYEQLEGAVLDLASQGLAHGIHLLIATPRYADVRVTLRDHLVGPVELRLADPMDSQIGRKAAATVPVGIPGRGLTSDKYHFPAALPRLAESADRTPAEATTYLVDAVRSRWDGPTAPPVRTLPTLLPADLESGSGKSSLLRLLARRISERYTPEEARLIIVDYRRSLLDSVETGHLVEYVPSGAGLPGLMKSLAESLACRFPGADVTPTQPRSRSWYTGPDVFLLVDDYDLVSTSSGNPLAPLLEHLPLARDLGLRVVLCRSSAGAARAMYDPSCRACGTWARPR
ncbi:FtsK/SpoIIIE domain-containing protein [Streptomyces sp. NPDC094466]|uniref:FtsK/SpoIIIE domain-containing protein n=1 Tax=Streptomyces sp. NPDC094466 TaxID=3366065 RepID=UPI00381067EA